MVEIQSFSISQSNKGARMSFAIHGDVYIQNGCMRFSLKKTHRSPVCIEVKTATVFPQIPLGSPEEAALKKEAALTVKAELVDWARTSNIIPEALRPEILRLFTVKNPADREIVK